MVKYKAAMIRKYESLLKGLEQIANPACVRLAKDMRPLIGKIGVARDEKELIRLNEQILVLSRMASTELEFVRKAELGKTN